MKKLIVAATMGTALALSLVACGGDDSDNTPDTMKGPAGTVTQEMNTGETSVTSTSQLGTIDQAKLDSFVVAFRAGYSDLSENRDDASIENIVISSCNDLANGIDEQQVTEKIRTLAANKGTEPSQDQAEHICDMVTPACP